MEILSTREKTTKKAKQRKKLHGESDKINTKKNNKKTHGSIYP
jgi:hypothetical protein